MKIPILPAAGAALVLLLSACQDPPAPTSTWNGSSLVAGTPYALTLEVQQHQDRWSGEYTVDAARGAFVGTLTGEALEAELRPSDACTYTLTGTVRAGVLEAEFVPSDCPSGQAGSWSLVRE